MLRLYQKLNRARTDRERLEAAAVKAQLYVARDGRGRVVAAK